MSSRRALQALSPHVDWSLMSLLRGEADAPSLDRIDVVQPALFAVMVSLAALWRSLGVEPAAVVGHSQGEIAAAYVAGALSLVDAARVVAQRSLALTRLAGQGAMAAVELPAAELAHRLSAYGGRLSIAAINSPQTTVVSGEPAALEALLQELSSAQVFARQIRVDYASHGTQVRAFGRRYSARWRHRAAATRARDVFDGDGGAAGDERLDAEYWYRNGRQTVQFAAAVQRLFGDGCSLCVEVSPHPVLTLALQETRDAGAAAAVVGSLKREQGEIGRFLLSLGELFAQGLPLDLRRVLRRGPERGAADVRVYARALLVEASRAKSDIGQSGLASAEHPLLGASLSVADADSHLFTGRLSLSSHDWLRGHAVFGR